MQASDGIREPELLARLRKPRTLLVVVAVALVWLLAEAQRPEARARGAAVRAAQQVHGAAVRIAQQQLGAPPAKAD